MASSVLIRGRRLFASSGRSSTRPGCRGRWGPAFRRLERSPEELGQDRHCRPGVCERALAHACTRTRSHTCSHRHTRSYMHAHAHTCPHTRVHTVRLGRRGNAARRTRISVVIQKTPSTAVTWETCGPSRTGTCGRGSSAGARPGGPVPCPARPSRPVAAGAVDSRLLPLTRPPPRRNRLG